MFFKPEISHAFDETRGGIGRSIPSSGEWVSLIETVANSQHREIWNSLINTAVHGLNELVPHIEVCIKPSKESNGSLDQLTQGIGQLTRAKWLESEEVTNAEIVDRTMKALSAKESRDTLPSYVQDEAEAYLHILDAHVKPRHTLVELQEFASDYVPILEEVVAEARSQRSTVAEASLDRPEEGEGDVSKGPDMSRSSQDTSVVAPEA